MNNGNECDIFLMKKKVINFAGVMNKKDSSLLVSIFVVCDPIKSAACNMECWKHNNVNGITFCHRFLTGYTHSLLN